MLGQRRRRWPNVKPTSVQRLMLATWDVIYLGWCGGGPLEIDR